MRWLTTLFGVSRKSSTARRMLRAESLEDRTVLNSAPPGGFTSNLVFYNLDDPALLPNYQETTTDHVKWFLQTDEDLSLSTFTRNFWSNLSYGHFSFGVDTIRDAAGNPVIQQVIDPPLNGDGFVDGYELAPKLVEPYAEQLWKASGSRERPEFDGIEEITVRLIPSVVLVHHNGYGGQAVVPAFNRRLDAPGGIYEIQEFLNVSFGNLPNEYGFPADWATLMHEYAHNFLDAPDLYGPPGGRLGYWDMLDNNPVPGRMSDTSSFFKAKEGWVTYKHVLSGPSLPAQQYRLQPYGTTGEAIKIVPDPVNNPGEYFLVEYRTPRPGADAWAPDGGAPEAGLLINHINESAQALGGVPSQIAPFMDLEESDGHDGKMWVFNYDRTHHWGHDFIDLPTWEPLRADRDSVGISPHPENNDPSWERSPGVLFPLDRSREFTPFTTPDSRLYGGRDSGVYITNIREFAGQAFFTVEIRAVSLQPAPYTLSKNDRFLPIDVNGDGRDEVLAYNGASLAIADARQNQFLVGWHAQRQLGSWQFSTSDRLLVADYNGDGRDDLLAHHGGHLTMFLGDGHGLSQVWSADGRLGNWPLRSNDLLYPGDFDGDGRTDLVVFAEVPSFRNDAPASLFLSAGRGFTQVWSTLGVIDGWRSQTNDQRFVGDFNGDGLDDLFVRGQSSAGLLTSTAAGFTSSGIVGGKIGNWRLTGSDGHRIGDFNGDGLDDIFVYAGSKSGVLRSRGTDLVHVWESIGGIAGPKDDTVDDDWQRGGADRFRVDDFNHDGRDDLYVRSSTRAGILRADGDGFRSEWVSGPVAEPNWVNGWALEAGDREIVGQFNYDSYPDVFVYRAEQTGTFFTLRYDSTVPMSQELGWKRARDLRPGDRLPDIDRQYLGQFVGDGRTDTLVWNGAELALFQNLHGNLQRVWQSGSAVGGWFLSPHDRFIVADFTGDGRDDLFVRGFSGAALLRATTTGFVNAWQSPDWVGGWRLGDLDREYAGDFTGDGQADLFLRSPRWAGLLTWNGTAFTNPWIVESEVHGFGSPAWRLRAADQHFVGDFNGDGRDEVIVRNGTTAGRLTWLGPGMAASGYMDGRIGGWQLGPKDRHAVGDFNGDGRDDLLVRSASAAGTLGWNDVAFVNPWFATGSVGSWQFGAYDRETVGDFDHDGRDELFVYRPDGGPEPPRAALWIAAGTGFTEDTVVDYNLSTWPLNAMDNWQAARLSHADRDELFVSHPGGWTGVFHTEGQADWNYLTRTQAHFRKLTADLVSNIPGTSTGGGVIAGTDRHDRITLTNVGINAVRVTVESFAAADYSGPRTVVEYTAYKRDGLLVEAANGNDTIIVRGDLNADVLVRGMGGVDHLIVDGMGAAIGTYFAEDAQNGVVTIGNSTIRFKEFNPGSTVTAKSFLDFTVVTPQSRDDVSVLGDTVEVSSGGKRLVSLVVVNVAQLTVDAAANDLVGNPDADDQVFVSVSPGAVLLNLAIRTGAGVDEVSVYETPSGMTTVVEAGTGLDEVHVGHRARHELVTVQGPVTIDGGPDRATLVLNDAGSAVAETFTLTAGGLTRLHGQAIIYSNIGDLTLQAGSDRDTIRVEGTRGATTVNGGLENDLIEVTPTEGNLELASGLTVIGGGGSDTLNLHDSLNPYRDGLGQEYTLTGPILRRSRAVRFEIHGFPPDVRDLPLQITYEGMTTLTLRTGDRDDQGDQVTVLSPTAATTVRTGRGDDTITVGDTTHPLSVAHLLTLDAGAGFDTLNLDDSAQVTMREYTMAGDGSFSFDAAPRLQYLAAEILNFKAGDADDTLDVTGVPPGTLPFVNGGEGIDTLTGSNAVNYFILLGRNRGVGSNAFFDSFENLRGGNSDHSQDYFIITNGVDAGVTGSINGAGGTNTLSYTQFVTDLSYGGFDGDVTVNLALGTATAVMGGISNIQHVIGSIRNDLLIGDNHANHLEGRGGWDILIGGAGVDTLEGGAGEDILIGGTTTFDRDVVALQTLQAGWTGQNLVYQYRVESIRLSQLNATTVLDDETVDELLGGDDSDWFWTFDDEISADYDLLTEILN